MGKGAIKGTIHTGTQAPVSSAQVVCHWAGLDGILSTPDDVPITVVANAAGSYDLTQLPYGLYSCTATDPATGTASTATQVTVQSTTLVVVDLQIGSAPAVPEQDEPELADTGARPPTTWPGWASCSSWLGRARCWLSAGVKPQTALCRPGRS
ncbi:hypothetical protein Aglo01_13650 [Actinokineospora globicatena]|nr:hypothetical protein Aglo01_13650 [Actinokineospora globicatena]GLW83716.1 hypothetical protein Aglo02_13560 [Actinokineospora globicatena]